MEFFVNLSTDEKLVHVYQLMLSEKNLAKERYDDIKKEISEVKQEISNTNAKVAAIEKKCNVFNVNEQIESNNTNPIIVQEPHNNNGKVCLIFLLLVVFSALLNRKFTKKCTFVLL